jgi:hypothetical protein
MRVLAELINDPRITPEIKERAINHQVKHTNMLKDLLTKQIIAERSGQGVMPNGGPVYSPPGFAGPAPASAPNPMMMNNSRGGV